MPADVRGNVPAARKPGDSLSPGAHLRATIERLGYDQGEVSEATGVSRQSINNIINDRQPISRAMAEKLGRLTGHGADYWLLSSFPREAGASPARAPDGVADAGHSAGAGVLVNHQIIRAVEDGIIGIEPFTKANVQPASIDLTLDDFIIAGGSRIDISAGQHFILEPARAASVTTKESVSFPQDHVGRVGAMASLAKLGIMTSHGFQIDPGYKGPLQFSVYNAGTNPYVFVAGRPIISVEIVSLGTSPSPDERAAKHLSESSRRDNVLSIVRKQAAIQQVREAMRNAIEVDQSRDEPVAKLAALKLEFKDTSSDTAVAAVIDAALNGLKTLRQRPEVARDTQERYKIFFTEIASRINLNAQEVRQVVVELGFECDGQESLVVALPHGKATLIELPTRSAKMSLDQIAAHLDADAADLILALSGLRAFGAA